jgi:hypothetical protein
MGDVFIKAFDVDRVWVMVMSRYGSLNVSGYMAFGFTHPSSCLLNGDETTTFAQSIARGSNSPRLLMRVIGPQIAKNGGIT